MNRQPPEQMGQSVICNLSFQSFRRRGSCGLADDQFGSKHFSLDAAAAAEAFQHQLNRELAHSFDGLRDGSDGWVDVPHPKRIVEGDDR